MVAGKRLPQRLIKPLSGPMPLLLSNPLAGAGADGPTRLPALITDGALRPVLRRTLMPPTWKMPSGCCVHLSKRGWLGLTKLASNTPCEPITSSVE